MSTTQTTDRAAVHAVLSALSGPLATSTADGQVRAADAPLAERLDAVRTKVAGDGSCSFTGWGS